MSSTFFLCGSENVGKKLGKGSERVGERGNSRGGDPCRHSLVGQVRFRSGRHYNGGDGSEVLCLTLCGCQGQSKLNSTNERMNEH